MFDLRHGRPLRLVAWLGFGIALTPLMARGDLPPGKPFVIPKDRAEWDARRPAVWKQVGGDLDILEPTPGYSAQVAPTEALGTHPDRVVESVHITGSLPLDPAFDGLLICPARATPASRVPLVILLVPAHPAGSPATAPGWDGRSPALLLAKMDFATLNFDDERFASPFGRSQPLRAALDVVLARPEIDPTRVAVLGLGRNGLTALGLMAKDARITCGIAAIEAVEATTSVTASFSIGVDGSSKATTQFEELTALCAPRPLCLMVGERLPLPNPAHSVGKILERVAKGAYKVYPKQGTGLSFTLFGEFAGHDSVGTRLQWMAALEHLDKNFRPQGPTPLPHPPEPEPTLDSADPEVLNLTDHGIAGWSPEMSGRDSTWTWRDGVVACTPRAHEYGWLRCPVAVDDFLLQVEWQVPDHGNAGIFLRARPVAWILPPTEENKLRVSSLGLTWPSRTGLELQTQADPGEANRYSTGSLYRHAAPSANPTHSPNQWNRSTVRARGPRVEVWNNGVQVLDADLNRCDDTLPDPPLQGYFGLQNHGAPAEYRAVRLKRLRPDAGAGHGATSRSADSTPLGKTSR